MPRMHLDRLPSFARRPSALATALVSSALLLAGCGGADTTTGGTGGNGGDGQGGETGTQGGGGQGAGTGTTSTEGGGTTGTTSTEGGGGAGGQGGGPPPTFLDQYPVNSQYPEGGIYDSVAHAFYVGSLGDGSVHRIDAATGAETVIFTESAPGAWWTLGMAVDEVRRRLWVCAMEDLSETDADPPYDGYVWAIDLEQGTREAVFPLSAADPEATCTDVTVTSDGLAYVVDRDFGNVYQVDIDAGPSLFAADSVLEAAIVGQNAVVPLPDESALMVTLYLPSRLARVDLTDGSVLDVDISGDFADAAFLSGADGMTYADGALWVAFSSELVKVTPILADWSSVEAVAVDVPGGMTDVVATPAGLYLLNGQAIKFALGETPDPFKLVRFTGNL